MGTPPFLHYIILTDGRRSDPPRSDYIADGSSQSTREGGKKIE